MMKKLVIGLFALLPTLSMAAGPSVPLMEANNDLRDKASLQRGAQLFMNYCLGCHQMQYQRYERTFRDIGIPTDIGEETLIFDGSKVGSHILNAMDQEDAAKWFGAPPPDLTLISRVKSPDYIYTYLKSFYKDESRPFGVNNMVFPLVGMPHVLQELQGLPTPITEEHQIEVMENGEKVTKTVTKVVGTETDGTGEMSVDEYDQAARDITNFLAYVGEPSRLESEALGYKVLGFLVIFFILAFFLKKEYWRDVH
ncbi:cytochrome c1 [Pseudoalteromonas 'SMAR']|uniref:cytochrome c1 n=1 Tax=Pseudoalteromonas 'SMAR' TaxID=3416908 RepID=UPI003AF2BFFF